MLEEEKMPEAHNSQLHTSMFSQKTIDPTQLRIFDNIPTNLFSQTKEANEKEKVKKFFKENALLKTTCQICSNELKNYILNDESHCDFSLINKKQEQAGKYLFFMISQFSPLI